MYSLNNFVCNIADMKLSSDFLHFNDTGIDPVDKQHKKMVLLTLGAPVTTAADDIHKYFFIVCQRKQDLMFLVNPLPSC